MNLNKNVLKDIIQSYTKESGVRNLEREISKLARKTRQLFKDEKYDDPEYYDYDYKYYVEEDEEYKKKWTRFTYINTALWDDYYTLEDRYIALEQEENKKKYKKPKQIIKKRKN